MTRGPKTISEIIQTRGIREISGMTLKPPLSINLISTEPRPIQGGFDHQSSALAAQISQLLNIGSPGGIAQGVIMGYTSRLSDTARRHGDKGLDRPGQNRLLLPFNTIISSAARAIGDNAMALALSGAGGGGNNGGPKVPDLRMQIDKMLAEMGDHPLQSRKLADVVERWSRELGIESWDNDAFIKNLSSVSAPLLFCISIETVGLPRGGLLLLSAMNLLPAGALKEAAEKIGAKSPKAGQVIGDDKNHVEQLVVAMQQIFKASYSAIHEKEAPRERLDSLKKQLLEKPVELLEALSKVLIHEFTPFAEMLGLENPDME